MSGSLYVTVLQNTRRPALFKIYCFHNWLQHYQLTDYFQNNLNTIPGIALEIILILLIVYTPLGNSLFGTAPIDGDVWLYAISFCLAMLTLDELRKALLRYFSQ
ncbi:MAG: cation transporting ATPase C-terminal domain-containing protein [Pseudomonadota bacterium]